MMRAGSRGAGVVWALLCLVGCGSGDDGGGTGGTGLARNAASVGVIAAKSSDAVTVNGVRFSSVGAQVSVNGVPATVDDIAPGMVAKVRGTVQDDVHGTAQSIEYAPSVIGPVEAVVGARLTVLGQTVFLDANTVCRDENAPIACATVSDDDTLEVSGLTDAGGAIRASYVKRRAPGLRHYRACGRIAALNPTVQTFALNALKVHYAAASGDKDMLANDRSVRVVGPLVLGAGLMATEIKVDAGLFASEQEGDEAEVEGYVSAVYAPGHFALDGETVRGDERTRYRGVTAQEIAVGMRLEVEGTLAGGVIGAHDIHLRARD